MERQNAVGILVCKAWCSSQGLRIGKAFNLSRSFWMFYLSFVMGDQINQAGKA